MAAKSLQPLASVVTAALATACIVHGAAAAELSPQDRQDVHRIEAYLNGIRRLSADFIQVAPDGSVNRGRFYLQRPGRLRFEYEPPASILVVADGTYVNYFDAELGQLSQIGVYATPLGAVVADEVKLRGRIEVTSVDRDPAVISLETVDTEEPGRGTLTLIFSERPLELRKWEVNDARGLTTTIALDNVSINPDLDPELFVFRPSGAEQVPSGD